jgi:hypothetical protein
MIPNKLIKFAWALAIVGWIGVALGVIVAIAR